jgi:Tfp pilus assembly protein PilF
MCQQIRKTLESTVNQHKDKMHEDLIEDLMAAMDDEQVRREKTFKEEYITKIERLAHEYEYIGDIERAEKYITQLIHKDPQNVQRWLELARFSMKIGNIDNGYHAFHQAKELDPENENLIIAFAGYLIDVTWYDEAEKVLQEILEKDFKHCHANILLSLI